MQYLLAIPYGRTAMILPNQHPDYRKPLDPVDAETLSVTAAEEVERYLTYRDNHAPTPLHTLPACAAELGVGAIHIKDEGFRLGLGSFKALGGSYAVRGSADGSPREEPDFEGLKAGKTVEIGGVRGCFRQVSAKPICRLDEIFEPTMGDVIRASGSDVLRFVPEEPGSLVSSPILFVQDQRHLIKG
jgi:hypothetical protein